MDSARNSTPESREKTSKDRSREIERYLKQEKKLYDQYLLEPRLLILGSSDSGKSTLLKQMKIMHGGGFSAEEKERAQNQIVINILAAVKTLLSHYQGTVEEYKTLSEWIESNLTTSLVPNDISAIITQAWKDKDIRQIYKEQESLFQDTIEYFLDDADKFLKAGYSPTNEDILNLRTVTLSVSKTTFDVENQKFHFFDVSGLSYHRVHWISYFDIATAVLFVVSLSSFDQVMAEDSTVNRMADALVLFNQICTNELLKKAGIVLFLNKRDIFQKKIRKISLQKYFPEYTGKDKSVSQGADFIKKKFLSQSNGKKLVAVHITCCTDTSSMKVLLSSLM